MFNIDALYKQTLNDFNDRLELIYLKYLNNYKVIDKIISEDILKNYLKRKGYIENFVLGNVIYVKDFTCVKVVNTDIEIWTDKTNNSKSLTIDNSHLTTLPIALKYFEKI